MTRNNSISGQIMASDNQIWTKVFFWKQLLHLPVNCAGVNTSNIFPYQNFQFFFFFLTMSRPFYDSNVSTLLPMKILIFFSKKETESNRCDFARPFGQHHHQTQQVNNEEGTSVDKRKTVRPHLCLILWIKFIWNCLTSS